MLIWNNFSLYINEKLNEFQGVEVKNFGVFTFEVKADLPKIDETKIGQNLEIDKLLVSKRTQNRLHPVFYIDANLKKLLTKFDKSIEFRKFKDDTVFKKCHPLSPINPIPIANKCFLKKSVVSEALNNIFKSIYDLITLGKNVSLKFDFAEINFYDKNLFYHFEYWMYQKSLLKDEIYPKIKKGLETKASSWISTFSKSFQKKTNSTLAKSNNV